MHDDTLATSPSPSRALVPAGAASRGQARPAPRPLAAFVAQLFACEARLEPFRSRRRTGSTRGAATYEAAGHAEPAAPAPIKRVL